MFVFFFFSSRRRHTRCSRDWSSDVCSSDLGGVTDPVVVLDRVRTEYLTGMQVEWLDPLGFNNSFAMTVRGEDARARHLEKLSDAAADPTGFALGAGYEFLQRPDGYGALNSAYQIRWIASPKSMDLGLLYTALLQKGHFWTCSSYESA